MQTEYPAATVKDAKCAVATVFSFRSELGDSGTLEVFLEELRYISKEAKAAGVKISGADWVYLADLANNVCDDDGLPRLFIAERADA